MFDVDKLKDMVKMGSLIEENKEGLTKIFDNLQEELGKCQNCGEKLILGNLLIILTTERKMPELFGICRKCGYDIQANSEKDIKKLIRDAVYHHLIFLNLDPYAYETISDGIIKLLVEPENLGWEQVPFDIDIREQLRDGDI